MFPWIFQEFISAPSSEKGPKGPIPTSNTEATFELNWDYSENGPANPIPNPNVCTFMGPIVAYHPEKKDPRNMLKTALAIMKKHGWKRVSDKDEYYEEEDEYEEYQPQKVVHNRRDDVMMVSVTCGWIYIRCSSKEAENFVEKHLRDSERFALAKVPHVEVTMTVDSPPAQGFTMTYRTGSGMASTQGNGGHPSSLSTLFELKKGAKTVAKSLCSYMNRQMGNPGPTIELLEVAKEWRRHGYGSRLLCRIRNHFEEIFLDDDVGSVEPVKFNVCYCTNQDAFHFFLSHGFQDWDGMGEELGMHLGEIFEEDVDEISHLDWAGRMEKFLEEAKRWPRDSEVAQVREQAFEISFFFF